MCECAGCVNTQIIGEKLKARANEGPSVNSNWPRDINEKYTQGASTMHQAAMLHLTTELMWPVACSGREGDGSQGKICK